MKYPCPYRLVMIAAASFAIAQAASAADAIRALGTAWKPDIPFPEYTGFWGGESNDPEHPGGGLHAADAGASGGTLHVFLRNDGREPLSIADVLLDGSSLKECLAFSDQRNKRKPASIYFANLPPDRLDALIRSGEPVWYKIDPASITPGGIGEIVVRLRQTPKADTARLALKHAGGTQDVSISLRPDEPRVASIGFDAGLKTVYACFRRTGGQPAAPAVILLNGTDVTSRASVGRDDQLDTAPCIIQLDKPLAPGELLCVQGIYADGATASAATRAWAAEFAYGIFGGLPGQADDVATARAYMSDLAGHMINVQMPQLGSSAVQSYLKQPAGQRYFAAQGLQAVIDARGKWGINDPYLYWIHDEPDCGDYRMVGMPEESKVGSLAQWCVQRGGELRDADASRLQILNIDMTYKPYNWYNYGQVPDVLAVDPYYQARLRTAYWKKPEEIPLYTKATYVYACASVCRSSSEPHPLHVILYANSYVDNDDQRQFRFPTPPEKRIEVYYALAAGARGLSYWWYTPSRGGKGGSAYGVGAAIRDHDPAAEALWREIGLMGTEIRTAGPLLTRSCAAGMPLEMSSGLWARTLLVGLDTVIVLVVNDQYANHDKGTDITPVVDARIDAPLPGWLEKAEAFEITPMGPRDIKARSDASTMTLDLGTVDVTRFIVITSDTGLRETLTRRYRSEFASKAARLIREAGHAPRNPR
jgi:hypothetical protein